MHNVPIPKVTLDNDISIVFSITKFAAYVVQSKSNLMIFRDISETITYTKILELLIRG